MPARAFTYSPRPRPQDRIVPGAEHLMRKTSLIRMLYHLILCHVLKGAVKAVEINTEYAYFIFILTSYDNKVSKVIDVDRTFFQQFLTSYDLI